MKFLIAIVVIFAAFSLISCDKNDSKNHEISKKFSISDLKYFEKQLESAKDTEKATKNIFNTAQNEYEEFVVGLNNLQIHLKSLRDNLSKIEAKNKVAFQARDKAHTALNKANQKYEEAKEEKTAAELSTDPERIASATKKYTITSREQMLSQKALKEADEVLENLDFELSQIKTAVNITQESYNQSLLEKQKKHEKLEREKEHYRGKIDERVKTEKKYNDVRNQLKGPVMDTLELFGINNASGSFRMKQIVGLICSVLTGAVAAVLMI